MSVTAQDAQHEQYRVQKERELRDDLYLAVKGLEARPEEIASVLINSLYRETIAEIRNELTRYIEQ